MSSSPGPLIYCCVMLFVAGVAATVVIPKVMHRSAELNPVEYDWIFLNAESVVELGIEFVDIKETHNGNLLISQSAVLDTPKGAFVFVKDFASPDTFLRVPVDVAKGSQESIEIIKGLFPGDQIAIPATALASLKARRFSAEDLASVLNAPTHGTEHEADNYVDRIHRSVRHFIEKWIVQSQPQPKFSSCLTH